MDDQPDLYYSHIDRVFEYPNYLVSGKSLNPRVKIECIHFSVGLRGRPDRDPQGAGHQRRVRLPGGHGQTAGGGGRLRSGGKLRV